jgi:hypothetical protein
MRCWLNLVETSLAASAGDRRPTGRPLEGGARPPSERATTRGFATQGLGGVVFAVEVYWLNLYLVALSTQ